MIGRIVIGMILATFSVLPATAEDRTLTLLGKQYVFPIDSEWEFFKRQTTGSGGEGVSFKNGRGNILGFLVGLRETPKINGMNCSDNEVQLTFQFSEVFKCLTDGVEKVITFRTAVHVPCDEAKYCLMKIFIIQVGGDEHAYDNVMAQFVSVLNNMAAKNN
jgi:hypothetical protein